MAWWSFDEGEGRSIKDRVSGEVDEIRGNYWYAEGVSGSCLKLDGYTTHVVRSGEKTPRLGDDFTIEATGIIGLQIHGGPPSEAWYRNITVVEL